MKRRTPLLLAILAALALMEACGEPSMPSGSPTVSGSGGGAESAGRLLEDGTSGCVVLARSVVLPYAVGTPAEYCPPGGEEPLFMEKRLTVIDGSAAYLIIGSVPESVTRVQAFDADAVALDVEVHARIFAITVPLDRRFARVAFLGAPSGADSWSCAISDIGGPCDI